MQIIKDVKSLVLTVFVAISALAVGYSGYSKADPWWAEVERCVKGKEVAYAKESSDGLTAPWMYNEWEEECAASIPDPNDIALEDIELEIKISSRPSRASDVARTEMAIISLSDRVIIEGLKVNRGNCSYSHHPILKKDNHPRSLGYGQGDTVYMYCAADRIREVTVYTSAGELTYNFR